jgi:hypothetical protein
MEFWSLGLLQAIVAVNDNMEVALMGACPSILTTSPLCHLCIPHKENLKIELLSGPLGEVESLCMTITYLSAGEETPNQSMISDLSIIGWSSS